MVAGDVLLFDGLLLAFFIAALLSPTAAAAAIAGQCSASEEVMRMTVFVTIVLVGRSTNEKKLLKTN